MSTLGFFMSTLVFAYFKPFFLKFVYFVHQVLTRLFFFMSTLIFAYFKPKKPLFWAKCWHEVISLMSTLFLAIYSYLTPYCWHVDMRFHIKYKNFYKKRSFWLQNGNKRPLKNAVLDFYKKFHVNMSTLCHFLAIYRKKSVVMSVDNNMTTHDNTWQHFSLCKMTNYYMKDCKSHLLITFRSVSKLEVMLIMEWLNLYYVGIYFKPK